MLTLVFNYTEIQMAHLSRPGPNIDWIGEVCDTLGRPSLTSLIDKHWAMLTLGELVFSEGRNYKLFFVPNRGVTNIANDTYGWLCIQNIYLFKMSFPE